MNSPIQHQPIECPGAPLKEERRLTLCLIGKETKRELFPNTDENIRPTTPHPREKPNGICHCPLTKCTCCYAPGR